MYGRGKYEFQRELLWQIFCEIKSVTHWDTEWRTYSWLLVIFYVFVTAEHVGTLDVNPAADLEQMRGLIQAMIKESQAYSNLTDWWFVDCEFFPRCFFWIYSVLSLFWTRHWYKWNLWRHWSRLSLFVWKISSQFNDCVDFTYTLDVYIKLPYYTLFE